MEASLKLLNQYVKVDDFTAEEIAAKLTSIGHEVEGMHIYYFLDEFHRKR